MVIENNQILNLMDTNGRRSDVLNALKIYLEILQELKEEYPTDSWGKFPDSIAQFVFYEKALEKSKDVFKKHDKYDRFIENIGNDYKKLLEKDPKWTRENFPIYAKVMDESIEKRARHYTSNLVKIGFTNSNREITEAGCSYLKASVKRDQLEELLPLDDVNITLLRQLLKLKVFSIPDIDGNRSYYSPFLMALVLLLDDNNIDKHTFSIIIQGLNPYIDYTLKDAILYNRISSNELEKVIQNRIIKVPEEIVGNTKICFELFKTYFKSSKNADSTSRKYYDFYLALNNFINERNEENYQSLISCFDKNNSYLQKAFGYGKNIFDIGNRGNRYSLDVFIEKNKDNHLLCAKDLASEIYITFSNSKWIDGIKEYSDTTIRLLSATGLFKFQSLPELAYKNILSLIFDVDMIRQDIFGQMTKDEFDNYENLDDCYFGKNTSISEIYDYSADQISSIISKISDILGVSSANDVKTSLKNQKNIEFMKHIHEKYSKEKIIELLPLFSNRSNDNRIKSEVNDAAPVPTIYEYIVAIAWYYISSDDYNLYESMNLTLNADFEPVIHAAGGAGDIVIDYSNLILMLEVTLMNKQAQKRAEWEPVLRHSLNLKAENRGKETLTFFIADELDYNTINIWRAVAAVPLESTNDHTKVEDIIIMPFTNKELLRFLVDGIKSNEIIENVKNSFVDIPKIMDSEWRESILNAIY